MTDNITEGRGMRKKKRNGWLEKDDADARAEVEPEAKQQRQPPMLPPIAELDELCIPPSLSLKSPLKSMPLPSVGLQMTSSFEFPDMELASSLTNKDFMSLSGIIPSNINIDNISISGSTSNSPTTDLIPLALNGNSHTSSFNASSLRSCYY